MKTTLTNPTHAEIDAAVAEHVAGWKPVCHCGDLMDNHRYDNHSPVQMDEPIPPYSTSADAVLPYIESMWDAVITRLKVNKAWQVDLVPSGGEYVVADGSASTLPMAACLALLRAHGVTVELTEEGK